MSYDCYLFICVVTSSCLLFVCLFDLMLYVHSLPEVVHQYFAINRQLALMLDLGTAAYEAHMLPTDRCKLFMSCHKNSCLCQIPVAKMEINLPICAVPITSLIPQGLADLDYIMITCLYTAILQL